MHALRRAARHGHARADRSAHAPAVRRHAARRGRAAPARPRLPRDPRRGRRHPPDRPRRRAQRRDDELLEHGRRWLGEMLSHGVTTAEAKSGYGLDTRDRAAPARRWPARLGEEGPVEIVPDVPGRPRRRARVPRPARRRRGVRRQRHRRAAAARRRAGHRALLRRLLRARRVRGRRVAPAAVARAGARPGGAPPRRPDQRLGRGASSRRRSARCRPTTWARSRTRASTRSARPPTTGQPGRGHAAAGDQLLPRRAALRRRRGG